MNPPVRISRVAGFGLTTPDAARLVEFYVNALGCRRVHSHRVEGRAFENLMNVHGGAERHRLALGNEFIDVLEFDQAGALYPEDRAPWHLEFQHFAVVVSDLDAAMRRLAATSGWSPISTQGPQHLPQRSGGVTAFKFRDPDGHPLELLAFPKAEVPAPWRARMATDLFCGIDHTAISVAETRRSVDFFEGLGFTANSHSLNHGPEQAKLDGVVDPHVEVTGLAPMRRATPHVELLCYRMDSRRAEPPPRALRSNDVAASRIELEIDHWDAAGKRLAESLLFDPDGHHCLLVPPAAALPEPHG